jgi:hypothetical protein
MHQDRAMEMITRQQAADRLGVPVAWIDGMIEAGELQYHEGPDGKVLVDAEDIQALKGVGEPPTVPSLYHVRAMLRRVMGGPDKVEQGQ